MRNVGMRIGVTATLALVLLGLTPIGARACWDGERARVGRVEISRGVDGDPEWNPAHARELALWLTRLDALLTEDGASVHIEGTFVEVCKRPRECVELEWNGQSFARLFRDVAAAAHAEPAVIRAARRSTAAPTTIQLGAFRSRPRANALIASLSTRFDETHGFYEAGGFPADNPTLHVIVVEGRDGRPIHRVVTGAFLTRRDAEAHVSTLRGALRGRSVLVRAL